MKKRLTEAQFQTAIKGLEIGQQTIDIARGVLVDGRPQAYGQQQGNSSPRASSE